MGDDDLRVEARTVLIGRGSGTTPEKIRELEQRAAQMEKAHRPKPQKAFGAVLAAGRRDTPVELSAKEKKRQALPAKGPRPGLVHPGQRDTYGRDEDSDDPVVLKG